MRFRGPGWQRRVHGILAPVSARTLIFFVMLFGACSVANPTKRTKIGSTPKYNVSTMAKANPVDSDGRKAAMNLKAKKEKKKSSTSTATGSSAVYGVLTEADGLPTGVTIEHSYLNFGAVGFYPSATPASDEISVYTSLIKLMATDAKIEAAEQSNNLNTGDFYQRKVLADVQGENAIFYGANPNVDSSTAAVVDVNAGDSVFGSISLYDGTYKRFEGTLTRSAIDPATHALRGYAYAISGSLPVNGSSVRYLARTKQMVTLRVDLSTTPMVVANGEVSGSFYMDFDMTGLFAGVDLTHITVAADGMVYIDDSNNVTASKAITKAIMGSLVTADPSGVTADSGNTVDAVISEQQ